MIRTTDFSALATSAPINKDAALARDGRGTHWSMSFAADLPRWDHVPPMKPVTCLSLPGQLIAAEMVGARFGRLRVLGVLAGTNPKKEATWVCRCDCGYFEGRKAKALRRGAGSDMACTECTRVAQLRQRGSKRAS